MSAHSQEASRVYYDDFSASYERGRDRGYHALVDELELMALAPYSRGGRVLEAGCGTGLLLREIDRTADVAVGVDLSAGMLGLAHRRGLNVVQGSVTALPFGDGAFDTVCSFKVLAHVPDLDLALRELVRVTRPGGHLVLEVYNRWSLRYLARRISGARRIGARHTESDIPTRWLSPKEAIRALPGSVELVDVRGVRVLTPAAAVHRVPAVSRVLSVLERQALSSPARWLGGFLVLVLRKRP